MTIELIMKLHIKINLSGLVKIPKFKQQFYFQLQFKCRS